MARKRNKRSTRRAVTKRAVTKRRRRSRPAIGGKVDLFSKERLWHGGYGYARGWMTNAVREKVTSRFGLNVSDNLAMAGLAFVAPKLIKKPIVRKAADAILNAEWFLAGTELSQGELFNGNGAGSGLQVFE